MIATLSLLGTIALGDLLSLFLTIVIAGLIFWVLLWAIDACGTPEPFNKVLKVIIIVIAVIFLINILLGLSGTHLFR
jgi:hypothetical protein